ncbi:hypothetical protein A3Q56_08028 [Intoshia linei]|uniref:Uncharacterized protein n=1 Tax=Intoshia linei TaxID=1819745 RepID=A0A177AQH9_9BILA|nr:hypothetical protein A3Q56_08028 [Intoshia linei]
MNNSRNIRFANIENKILQTEIGKKLKKMETYKNKSLNERNIEIKRVEEILIYNQQLQLIINSHLIKKPNTPNRKKSYQTNFNEGMNQQSNITKFDTISKNTHFPKFSITNKPNMNNLRPNKSLYSFRVDVNDIEETTNCNSNNKLNRKNHSAAKSRQNFVIHPIFKNTTPFNTADGGNFNRFYKNSTSQSVKSIIYARPHTATHFNQNFPKSKTVKVHRKATVKSFNQLRNLNCIDKILQYSKNQLNYNVNIRKNENFDNTVIIQNKIGLFCKEIEFYIQKLCKN